MLIIQSVSRYVWLCLLLCLLCLVSAGAVVCFCCDLLAGLELKATKCISQKSTPSTVTTVTTVTTVNYYDNLQFCYIFQRFFDHLQKTLKYVAKLAWDWDCIN